MFDLGRSGFSSKSTMWPAASRSTQPCRPARRRRSGMRAHRVTGAARSREKRSGPASSKAKQLVGCRHQHVTAAVEPAQGELQVAQGAEPLLLARGAVADHAGGQQRGGG